ncbi:MAG: cobalt-precorrin-5B (C(1))-methyltransferase [Roseburia inulinivorans]
MEIETPKGIRYHAEITDIRRSETAVSCAVIKDGGDDPDITTGAHIVAEVSRIDGGIQQKNRPCIGKRVRWMAACSKKGSPRIYRES